MRQLFGNEMFLIPAEAHFYGNGQAGGASYGRKRRARLGKILQKRAAVAVTDDFRRGTAHIDVQPAEPLFGQHARSLVKRVRFMAEDLQRDKPFAGIAPQKLAHGAAFFMPAQIAAGGNHLRRRPIAPLLKTEQAEGHIRHARHRRERRGALC